MASNGGIQGKEYNANIPETADELADSVHEAYEAGASMVHLHARDPNFLPGPAKTTEVWYELNKKVRERCPDIIINDTTGGGLDMTMEERLSCLAAKPEFASLNLSPDMSKFKIKAREAPLRHPRPAIDYDDCLPFSYKQISWYASEMKKHGVKPGARDISPGLRLGDPGSRRSGIAREALLGADGDGLIRRRAFRPSRTWCTFCGSSQEGPSGYARESGRSSFR